VRSCEKGEERGEKKRDKLFGVWRKARVGIFYSNIKSKARGRELG
jgi:hypothetical protein